MRLLLFSLLAGPALAELPIFTGSKAYDGGDVSKYPMQSFRSSAAVVPRPNLLRRHGDCARDLITLITPRGFAGQATHLQATMLDQDGRLVWTSD